MLRHQILNLDPDTYQRHLIHGENRTWAETNCYTDLLIEQLHALGHEPIACLAFTLAIDFEGDQWTFFKFPPEDVATLYGLEILELAIWKPLDQHIEEQLSRKTPILAELDSYFLPDTAGTAYKRAHVKTTVAVNDFDRVNERMGYFHNQGYFFLSGQDFREILQLDGVPHDRVLPPYVEILKKAHGYKTLDSNSLLDASLTLLTKHLARAPSQNPFLAFKMRFETDLNWLMTADQSVFHAYSFATLRQLGANFELAETYVRWLMQKGVTGLDPAIQALHEISHDAKTLQFQLARAMARKRTLDLSPLDIMAEHWTVAMNELRKVAP